MKPIWLLMVFLGLMACGNNQGKKIDDEGIKFSTSDDSELYFKNVRQIYYDKESPANTKLEVFRFGKRNKENGRPILNLSIVFNWVYDEAYILLEPNSYFKEAQEIEVEWKDKAKKQSGAYTFSFGSKEKHFQFATQVYQSILAGHELFIQDKNKQWIKLFANETDQDNFRKTMVDYYKLVNLY